MAFTSAALVNGEKLAASNSTKERPAYSTEWAGLLVFVPLHNVASRTTLGIVVVLASPVGVLPAWYFGGEPGSRLEFTKLIPSARFVNFES